MTPNRGGLRFRGPRGMRSYLLVWGPDRAVDTAFDAAFGWAVAQSVDSPVLAALLFALSFAPQTVLLIFGGALGDRWGLLRTAASTLVARIAIMVTLGIALLSDRPAAWLLIIVALAISVLDSWHFPAVEGLAGKLGGENEEAQGQVSSASQSVGRLGQMLGGYALGALIGWRPSATAFAGAALLAMALIFLAALTRERPDLRRQPVDEEDAEPPLFHQIARDLRHVRGIPTIWALLTTLALSNALSAPVLFLGLALRAQSEHWNGVWYAAALASFPLGALLGGYVVNTLQPRLSQWTPSQRMSMSVGCVIPASLGMALVAAAPPPFAALGALWAGFAFAPSASLIKARIRTLTPPTAQGLANAVSNLGVYVGIPAGHMLFGLVASALDARAAGLTLTCLLALSGVACLTAVQRRSESRTSPEESSSSSQRS